MTDIELTESGITVSPSQIGSALTCLRRWAYEKVEDIRSPSGAHAQVGTRVHAILESWLRNATPPNLEEELKLEGKTWFPGLIAFNILHLLPPPGPHMKLELKASALAPWFGYIDWAYTAADGTPCFGDHKTSSDHRKYGLDEESIRNDPQAVVYANIILNVFKSAPYTDGFWNYVSTRKPYTARQVKVRFTRAEAAAALIPYDRLAKNLIRLRLVPGLRAIDVPPNPTGCSSFGGCYFRDRCTLTPEQAAQEYLEMEPQSLEEKMQMTMNGAASVLSAPPPLPWAPPAPWEKHPNAEGWWFQPGGERAYSTAELQLAYPPPPPVVPPIPQIPEIPAIVPAVQAQQALPAIVALPIGMINSPEAQGVAQRAEPALEAPQTNGKAVVAVAAPGVVDDLTPIDDRASLVAICSAMGLGHKGIRVPGLKDMIRAGRAAGGKIITADPLPKTTLVTTPTPTGMPAPGDEWLPEAAPLDASQMQRDRIVLVSCALLTARERFDDDMELVRRARSIVALIERG